jgi:hypothetical protein
MALFSCKFVFSNKNARFMITGYKNRIVLLNINKFYSIFFFFRKYIVFLQTLKYGVITLNISVSINK